MILKARVSYLLILYERFRSHRNPRDTNFRVRVIPLPDLVEEVNNTLKKQGVIAGSKIHVAVQGT